MKKLLFICDPLDTFNLKTDTTYILMVMANYLNFEVYYSLPKEVFSINNQAFAKAHKLEIFAKPDNQPETILPWYKEQELSRMSLTDFNAVFVRNDPPFNMEYYYLTVLLSLAEKKGVKVINNSYSLRNFNEKLSILNFPNLIAPTLVCKDKETILDFIHEHTECVIKPLDLMAGRGIFKLSPSEVNLGAIIETSTNYYTQTVMIQKFIPEVVYGDKRIFIVNGKVIPNCLHRIPANNQIRGNIAAGGRGEVHPLTDQDYKIASEVATWLQLQNIIFAGIDVIGDRLTEINITSPTGTRQILTHANIDISKLILENLE